MVLFQTFTRLVYNSGKCFVYLVQKSLLASVTRSGAAMVRGIRSLLEANHGLVY
jgi:hypothetical protein